jgi:hypothetical protein
LASLSGVPCTRQVEPNAAMTAVRHGTSRARSKNSASFGLDPGQPPSMNANPNSSRRWATRILSAADSEMPARWVPSLSVVS